MEKMDKFMRDKILKSRIPNNNIFVAICSDLI